MEIKLVDAHVHIFISMLNVYHIDIYISGYKKKGKQKELKKIPKDI